MATVHTFGSFRLDADAEILFCRAEPLGLGRRAVALLRVLLERAGMPVGKEVLIEAAWPGLAIEDSNLTVQMAAIRRALSEDGGSSWIETLPRRGYRYIGPEVTSEDVLDKAACRTPSSHSLPSRPSVAVLRLQGCSIQSSPQHFAHAVGGIARKPWAPRRRQKRCGTSFGTSACFSLPHAIFRRRLPTSVIGISRDRVGNRRTSWIKEHSSDFRGDILGS